MGDKPSAREAALRARILDAARELFAERAPNRVTVRDVAERAGVQHSVVHRYFGTKAELIDAVAAADVAVLTEAVATAGDGVEAALAATAVLEQRSLGVRATLQALLDEAEPVSRSGPHHALDAQAARVAAERGVPVDDGDLRADLVVSGALLTAWPVVGPHLARLFGLDPEDVAVRSALRRAFSATVGPRPAPAS